MNVINNFLELNTIVVAIFGISIFKLIKQFFSFLIENKKKKEKEIEEELEMKKEEKKQVDKRLKNLEDANVAILHNKIYRQCTAHIADGYISIPDLDDLGYLYSAYVTLGGNGTGEDLYNKVKELPNFIKEGEDN